MGKWLEDNGVYDCLKGTYMEKYGEKTDEFAPGPFSRADIFVYNFLVGMYYSYSKRKVNLCELGSFCGRSLTSLKEWFDNDRLNAVSLDINEKFLKISRKEFCRYGLVDKIIQIQGDSVASLMTFPKSYFDIIFIDTSHVYEQVIEELYISQSRLKDNGILCGHDLYYPNPEREAHLGVFIALEEFTEDYPRRFYPGTYENESSSIWAVDKNKIFLNYEEK